MEGLGLPATPLTDPARQKEWLLAQLSFVWGQHRQHSERYVSFIAGLRHAGLAFGLVTKEELQMRVEADHFDPGEVDDEWREFLGE